MPEVRWAWLARGGVSVLVAVMLGVGVVTASTNWHLTDLKAYIAAADALATGGNPYSVELVARGLPYHYHYAPWFAAVFVPLTWLPVEIVRVGWSLVLLAASGLAIAPVLLRYGRDALPLAGLMTFLLLNLVAEGNVQPLLLAGLVGTLERRSGPLVIGLAASLKLVPILFAVVYVGRREWVRAAVAVVTAGVLMAPTLLFEIEPQALDTGGTGLFTSAPPIWAASALAGLVAAVVLARSRFAWLAAATATVLALPRLLIFDVTNLVAALPSPGRDK